MGKARRARRGAQQWRVLLARHARSGLTVAGFCRGERIGVASLYHWRAKLSGAQARLRTPVATRNAAETFVDLGAMPAPGSARFELRVDLGGGLSLHLARG